MTGVGVHIDEAALADSMDALATTTTDTSPLESGVAAVIDATRRLFAVTGAGLLLVDHHGALRYVGATDDTSRELEAAQEDLAEGPGVDCLVLGALATCADLATDDRWPRLRERVVPAGVRALLAVATRVAGSPVGSLTVYRSGPYAWDGSDVAAIEAYASVLESLLGGAIASRRNEVLVSQLQTALDRRIVIERAIGALMERHGVNAVVAFGALRRTARDARRSVADLAAETIDGGDAVASRLLRADPA